MDFSMWLELGAPFLIKACPAWVALEGMGPCSGMRLECFGHRWLPSRLAITEASGAAICSGHGARGNIPTGLPASTQERAKPAQHTSYRNLHRNPHQDSSHTSPHTGTLRRDPLTGRLAASHGPQVQSLGLIQGMQKGGSSLYAY